jgi:hypothetical protein
MEEEKPSPETLRSFIAAEWADLHHSRVQEWTALGIVAGVHLVALQLAAFLIGQRAAVPPRMLLLLASTIAAAFAVFGILVTCRHRHLMNVKLHWIFQAEDQLGLVHDEGGRGIIPRADGPTRSYRWKGLSAPRPLSTGGLIIGFYALLILVDILVPIALWRSL